MSNTTCKHPRFQTKGFKFPKTSVYTKREFKYDSCICGEIKNENICTVMHKYIGIKRRCLKEKQPLNFAIYIDDVGNEHVFRFKS